ncbi:hypothetical protein FZC76_09220 [Sutcliffiella horikoshii]|uniref:Uncharacterized protein n=1 Tax=Sutcliffiella horikoshii TaxID=79883 RepID=A0A5D4T4J2_9BACI|nr:hypothetical protein FZC76_09220 [Sutcliffiella horikoshii]
MEVVEVSQLLIGAKGEDSGGTVATILRPRRLAEEAQGRPWISEAICGNQQRCSTEQIIKYCPT